MTSLAAPIKERVSDPGTGQARRCAVAHTSGDIALLIDVFDRFGRDASTEVDLGELIQSDRNGGQVFSVR